MPIRTHFFSHYGWLAEGALIRDAGSATLGKHLVEALDSLAAR
ncbi:hypothetical protein [Williamsia sp. CHRR-6]|nr:hypothetical protein [Williamsia sp. CHRR-6]